jgi:hypothetical protein
MLQKSDRSPHRGDFGINSKHFQWLAILTLTQARFAMLHSCCSKAAT